MDTVLTVYFQIKNLFVVAIIDCVASTTISITILYQVANDQIIELLNT